MSDQQGTGWSYERAPTTETVCMMLERLPRLGGHVLVGWWLDTPSGGRVNAAAYVSLTERPRHDVYDVAYRLQRSDAPTGPLDPWLPKADPDVYRSRHRSVAPGAVPAELASELLGALRTLQEDVSLTGPMGAYQKRPGDDSEGGPELEALVGCLLAVPIAAVLLVILSIGVAVLDPGRSLVAPLAWLAALAVGPAVFALLFARWDELEALVRRRPRSLQPAATARAVRLACRPRPVKRSDQDPGSVRGSRMTTAVSRDRREA